jgi:hypothetical protein
MMARCSARQGQGTIRIASGYPFASTLPLSLKSGAVEISPQGYQDG